MYKEQFNLLQHKYPDLSTCMIFVKMVKGKRIGDSELSSLWDRFVERDDYRGTPKAQVMEWLKEEILKPKSSLK